SRSSALRANPLRFRVCPNESVSHRTPRTVLEFPHSRYRPSGFPCRPDSIHPSQYQQTRQSSSKPGSLSIETYKTSLPEGPVGRFQKSGLHFRCTSQLRKSNRYLEIWRRIARAAAEMIRFPFLARWARESHACEVRRFRLLRASARFELRLSNLESL